LSELTARNKPSGAQDIIFASTLSTGYLLVHRRGVLFGGI